MKIISVLSFCFAALFCNPVHAEYFVWYDDDISSSMRTAPPSTTGIASRNVVIDGVSIDKLDVSCSLFWKLQPSKGKNFPDFLKSVLSNELKAAGIYDTAEASIRLEIAFSVLSLTSPKLFLPGEWQIALTIRSSNGSLLNVHTRIPIKGFATSAQDGCEKSQISFSLAIENLVNLIGSSSEYPSLFQLTEIEQAKWIASVAESKEIRRKAEEQRQAKLESDKAAQEALAAAELARDMQTAQRLRQLERLSRTNCIDKSDCDRKFALTQIFISERADMKIQLATDVVIETYNPTEEFKMGAKAIKVPMKANASEIRINFSCKSPERLGNKASLCEQMKLNLFEAYILYMSSGGD